MSESKQLNMVYKSKMSIVEILGYCELEHDSHIIELDHFMIFRNCFINIAVEKLRDVLHSISGWEDEVMTPGEGVGGMILWKKIRITRDAGNERTIPTERFVQNSNSLT